MLCKTLSLRARFSNLIYLKPLSLCWNSNNADNCERIDSDLSNLKLPLEPTTCCMSACANCVWIEYANQLNEIFRDGGEKSIKIIEKKISNPNMKAYLMTELRIASKKSNYYQVYCNFFVIVLIVQLFFQINELTSIFAANNISSNSNLVFIEANDTCDASFMTTTLLWESINTNLEVITIMLHHSTEHYLQLLSKIAHGTSLINRKMNSVNLNPVHFLEGNVLDIQKLIQNIVNFFEEKKHAKPCLIIDDISYICLLSSFKDCIYFSRICLKLLSQYSNSKLIIGCHVTSDDEELSIISRFFENISKFSINLYPLQSGFSSDVTGHLIIRNRSHLLISRSNKYHYRLEDRKISVTPYIP